MRLELLRLKNFRKVGEEGLSIEFDPSHQVTILVGINGSGKTTVLDAIAKILSQYVAVFPKLSGLNFIDSDVHITNDSNVAPWLEAELKLSWNGKRVSAIRYKKGDSLKCPDSELKDLRNQAENIYDEIKAGHEVEVPVLAYYGTGRGQIQLPERKRGFQKEFSRLDCYQNALAQDTNFKRFFAWFDLMEDEERRERERKRDFGYKSHVLEAVRTAIVKSVGQHYTNPRIELHPLRFVVDEIGNGDRQLRLEQMSDGFKMMLAMTSDLASRMAEANPKAADPLQSHGVVLIDEVDLHLHPSWQRTVIRTLTDIFPNVQFIVTTHSPIVALGASDIAQIVLLDDKSEPLPNGSEIESYDVSTLLMSPIFGSTSSYSPKWDKSISRRNELMAKPSLTPEEEDELKQLDKELAQLSINETSDALKLQQMLLEFEAKS